MEPVQGEEARVRFFTYDGNGNVGQVVVADDGAVAAHYEYDPYGNALLASGADAQDNPFRFSTKYLDVETGLVYYGMRYYLPELGRWGSRDPLTEFGGANLYAFIFNNPIGLIDYLGMACDLQSVAGTAITGAALGYLSTYMAKKIVTTGAKVVLVQAAPVLGQAVGVGMTVWEAYSFGKTAYRVYTNAGKIKAALSVFYDDPDVLKWIDCLTEEECNALAEELGELVGSLAANGKEIRTGIQKITALIRSYAGRGKKGRLDFVKQLIRDETGAIELDLPGSRSRAKWKPGDDVYEETIHGYPSDSTIRRRFWKKEAEDPTRSDFLPEDFERMERGLPPRRYNPDKPGMESMERSHEPTPKSEGGTETVPRWPQEHAEVDKYRRPGY